ncbi:MAG: cytochrome c maturation protein CcmE [Burkholderiales bacterium]|nr:cytochrome c maturation protein CcmE [Burkholderiales bacterium]
MKPRTKRLLAIVIGLICLAIAAFLVFQTFQSNLVFFFSPSQIVAKEAPIDKAFRIGGLVKAGSLQRDPAGLKVNFIVTDLVNETPVSYVGMLPDLFKEGKGVVAQGRLNTLGVFVADQVLAKHDENYMPPEAEEALKKAQSHQTQAAPTLSTPSGGKR